jgi:hypothetical protein
MNSPPNLITSSALPGINKTGMLEGTARDSAIANCNNNNTLLASLNAVGGRRHKKTRGGFQSIVVPTIDALYPQTLTGSQSTIGQMIGNATTITTNSENAKYDNLAASPQPIPANQLTGGRRKRRTRTKKSRKGTKKSRKGTKKSKKKSSRRSRKSN